MRKQFNLKQLVGVVSMLILVLSSNVLNAQSTGIGINFQALARDNNANPARDRVVYVQASIIQGSASGNVLLTEEFKTTTDATGIFLITLGQGQRVGGAASSLTGIDWSMLPFYLSVKIAITPNAPILNWDYTKDWTDLGASLIGSVPHSLYAETVKGFNTKLNISDTGRMMAPYANLRKMQILDSTTTAGLNAKVNLSDSLTKYVTPAQLNSKTFDSSNIYRQLSLRAPLASPNFTGTVTGITKAMVGLGNVDNTSDAAKPISNAVQTSLNLKEDIANKSTASDLGGLNPSNVLFPTQKAVKDYISANSAAGGVADGGIITIKLADGGVTFSKFQPIQTNKILGRLSAGFGNVEELSTSGTGNVVLTNAPVLVNPDLGTPSVLVGTNISGTANNLTAGNVLTNANLNGVVTSLGNTTSIANGAITNDMIANGAVANLSGTNTGDETNASIKSKLGVTGFFSGAYSDLTGIPNLFSGSYNDLSNKPTLFSGVYADLSGKPNLFSGAYADLIGKPILFSGAYSDLTGKPNLFSGSYVDLTNKPVLFSGAYADLTGKPNLFSGSYADLTNKPTIPAAQIISDWAQTDNTKLDYISNKPNLFSGNYNDLTNKPTLFTGAYADLTGKPNIFSGSYNDLTNKPTLFSGAYADLTGKPSLSTVALSGTYTDLTGKPDLSLKQDVSNKSIDVAADGSSDILYPSVKAVKTYVDAQTAAAGVADGGITTIKLANGAVTTLKIADGSVTNAKLANTAVASLTGVNTGDETEATIKTKLGVSSFFSGAWADLTGKPSIPAAQLKSDWNQTDNTKLDYILNKPTLSTVAISGTYTDLTGKPNLSTVAISGTYTDLTGKPDLDLKENVNNKSTDFVQDSASDTKYPSVKSVKTFIDATVNSINNFNADITVNEILFGRGSGNLDNVVVGKNAFTSNTGANRNIAIGTGTLSSNLIGDNNTGVGWQALISEQGSGNVAIGSGAGARGVVGDNVINSTFIGTNATAPDYTPVNNGTAIGYGAVVQTSNTIQLGNTDVTKVLTTGSLSLSQSSFTIGTAAMSLGDASIAVGNGTIAMGSNSNAIGMGSIALGNDNHSTGDGSIALGSNTNTNGAGSISLGKGTNAIGMGSIAMGDTTYSNGVGSISMGKNTNAIANGSIAMGSNTYSNGAGSIALGTYTNAIGAGSIALGDSTYSNGAGSIAMGKNNNAIANGSIAMGSNTYSNGAGSIALGNYTNAIGAGSIALGDSTYSNGAGSIALGKLNNAIGDGSIALGRYTYANGLGTLALGFTTNAIGEGSIALGDSTYSNGIGSIALGSITNAIGDGSIALGRYTYANGLGSLSLGFTTNAIGEGSIALGDSTYANGIGSISLGSNTNAIGKGAIAMGTNTYATGNGSLAMGDSTNSIGTGSLSIGNNTTSVGSNSLAIGYYTSTPGMGALAIGDHTSAYSYGELVIGQYNIGSGSASSISWNSTDHAFTIGNGTDEDHRSNVFNILKNGAVVIGANEPNESSILDMSAIANKGVILPNVALTSNLDATTIANPKTGLLVYNYTTTTIGDRSDVVPGFYYNEGPENNPSWVKIATGAGSGADLGNYSFDGSFLISNNNVIINSGQAGNSIYLYNYGSDGEGTGSGEVDIEGTGVVIWSKYDGNAQDAVKWIFNQDGNIVLPANGDVLRDDGSGQLVSVLGAGGGLANFTFDTNTIIATSSDQNNPNVNPVLFGNDAGKIAVANFFGPPIIFNPNSGESLGLLSTDYIDQNDSNNNLYGSSFIAWTSNMGGDWTEVYTDNEGVTIANYVYQNNTQNNYEWKFNLDGNFILPANGDILKDNGSGQLVSVLGAGAGLGNFHFTDNSLIATSGDNQNPNNDPVVLGNDDKQLSIGNFEGTTGIWNTVQGRGIVMLATDDPAQNLYGVANMVWTSPDGTAYTQSYANNEGFYINVNLPDQQNNAVDRTWTFDLNGNITLPIGGDILDSDGNSVLGAGAGLGHFSFDGSTMSVSANNDISIISGQNSPGIFLYNYGSDGDGTGAGEVDIETDGVTIWSSWNQGPTGIKWVFNQDGNIVIPTNGDILKDDGSGQLISVLGGSGGSASLDTKQFVLNSSVNTFELDHAPRSIRTVFMFINGIRINNDAYEIDSSDSTHKTIHYTSNAHAFVAGDRVQFDYQY